MSYNSSQTETILVSRPEDSLLGLMALHIKHNMSDGRNSHFSVMRGKVPEYDFNTKMKSVADTVGLHYVPITSTHAGNSEGVIEKIPAPNEKETAAKIISAMHDVGLLSPDDVAKAYKDMGLEPETLISNFEEGAGIAQISIEIKEVPNHGAPCDFKVVRGTMKEDEFFKKMSKVADEINKTPDDYPKNPFEMSDAEKQGYSSGHNRSGNQFNYPNYRGTHVYTGYDTKDIDGISAKDAKNVAAKIIRLMAHEELLTQAQMEQAYKDFKISTQFQVNSAAGRGRGDPK